MRAARNRSRTFAFVTAAAIAMATAAVTHAGGRCHTADLAHEVVLPDGSVHAPGELTSCRLATHSPISSLVELSIDGHPVHMVIGREGAAELKPQHAEPFFVFQRNADDQMVLQGYAVPRGGELVTYQLDPSGESGYKVSSRWGLLSAGERGASSPAGTVDLSR